MIKKHSLFYVFIFLMLLQVFIIIRNTVASSKRDNNSCEAVYIVFEDVFIDKDIKIGFPQIKELTDTDKQRRINEIIKNDALGILNFYSEDTNLTLEINYKILWKGKELLSIQYFGLGYVSDASYPNNLLYTTNVDIGKGRKVHLNDVLNINETLIKKFVDGYFQALNSEHTFVIDLLLAEDIANRLERADFCNDEGKVRYPDAFSYFTRDSLGIIFSIPHSQGDNAEFKIRYDDIIDNINFDNKMWQDFFS